MSVRAVLGCEPKARTQSLNYRPLSLNPAPQAAIFVFGRQCGVEQDLSVGTR
jgi:hypothetical protein